MGSFADLHKAEMRIEYTRGFREGYLIGFRKRVFLKRVMIGEITRKIRGIPLRMKYKSLFNNPVEK